MPQSEDLKTPFKFFLAILFLSLRANLLCTLSLRGPCITCSWGLFRYNKLEQSEFKLEKFIGIQKHEITR